MSSLLQLYSQETRSTSHSDRSTNRLVVSEDLWFACVLNGTSLDFFDLNLQPPEAGLCALSFLSTTRMGAPCTEAALSPHDPTIMAVGTTEGTLAFLRLRRTISPTSIAASAQPGGPLLVHKTLERTLAPPDAVYRPTDAIRFHPTYRGLCALVCARTVFLAQHDVGLLATSACCAGSSDACSVAWCGPLLAVGEADGAVRMWRLTVTLVDPRTPATALRVEAEAIGILSPPVHAATASAMRWIPIDGADSADDDEEEGEEEDDNEPGPLGVLCCGYTSAASAEGSTGCGGGGGLGGGVGSTLLRVWSLSARGEVYMLASLPTAPLKGATELLFSDTLAPAPLPITPAPTQTTADSCNGGADDSCNGGTDDSCNGGTADAWPTTRDPESVGAAALAAAASHPLRARSFRAAASPRWILCGASGSSSVFALPWGRAGSRRGAEATFPTAVELLCAPSLALHPPPAHGVRGIHTLVTAACRGHVAEALGVARERAFFSGPHAPGGCDLVLVLSDRALHVVLHASMAPARPPVTLDGVPAGAGVGFQGDEAAEADDGEEDSPAGERAPVEVSDPVRLPAGKMHTPLLAHLLPSVSAAARDPPSRPSAIPKPLPVARPTPAKASGGADDAAQSAATGALLERIAELELRAVTAEARLGDLHTAFNLYAANSRQQTNQLLAALEQLVQEKALAAR